MRSYHILSVMKLILREEKLRYEDINQVVIQYKNNIYDLQYNHLYILNKKIYFLIKKKKNLFYKQLLNKLLILIKNYIKLHVEHQKKKLNNKIQQLEIFPQILIPNQ